MLYSLVNLNKRLGMLISAIPEDREIPINIVRARVNKMDDESGTLHLDASIEHYQRYLLNRYSEKRDACDQMFGSTYVEANRQSGVGVFNLSIPFFRKADNIPYIRVWVYSKTPGNKIWKTDAPASQEWISRMSEIKSWQSEKLYSLFDPEQDTITIRFENDPTTYIFHRVVEPASAPPSAETKIAEVDANVANMAPINSISVDPRNEHAIRDIGAASASIRDICTRMFGAAYMIEDTQRGFGSLSIRLPFFQQADTIPYIKILVRYEGIYKVWKTNALIPSDWLDALKKAQSEPYTKIDTTLDSAADTITVSIKGDPRTFVFCRAADVPSTLPTLPAKRPWTAQDESMRATTARDTEPND